MNTTIHCQFQSQPGAFERILRVIRVRGFDIVNLNAGLSGEHMQMEVTISGNRCFDNLCLQLEKLQEITEVGHLTVASNQRAKKLA